MEKYIKYFRFSVCSSTKTFHIRSRRDSTDRKTISRALLRFVSLRSTAHIQMTQSSWKVHTKGSLQVGGCHRQPDGAITIPCLRKRANPKNNVKHQHRSLVAAPFTALYYIATCTHIRYVAFSSPVRPYYSSNLSLESLQQKTRKNESRWILKFLSSFCIFPFFITHKFAHNFFLLFSRETIFYSWNKRTVLSHIARSSHERRRSFRRKNEATRHLRSTERSLVYFEIVEFSFFLREWWLLLAGPERYTKN